MGSDTQSLPPQMATKQELCSEGGPQHGHANIFRFSWPQLEEDLGMLVSCGPMQWACVLFSSVH